MNVIGIDVSSYQGKIDWSFVKASGIKFAILRIIKKDLNMDAQFENNWNGCQNAGVEVKGVYNYSYATTVDKAVSDAKRVLEILNGRKTTVWLDVEDDCQKTLGAHLLNIIEAYAEVIKKAGLEFGVYTGRSFYNSYLKPYGGVSYPLWIASYGSNDGSVQESYRPNIEGMVAWQYTSKGIVNGINTCVDMNMLLEESEEETMGNKYIAHASIDENGKIAGGKAGDQTGKEVCIRTWYKNSWGYVLRITNEAVRNQFANNMIDLANNDNVGYDQNQRNTLLTKAEKAGFDLSKITEVCECDCSSAVTVAILGAIYKVLGRSSYEKALAVMYAGSNCATTRTLRSRLAKLDMISVREYTSNTYTSGTSYAVYGDIYLKEGSHVVAYIDNGEKMCYTESDGSNNSNDTKEYTGNSIVDYLNSIGKPSDFASRKSYAELYGIKNYTGTSAQNTSLLNAMRKGGETVSVFYDKYTGSSGKIDVVLKEIGVPEAYRGSWSKRKKVAAANGISLYVGSAKQNNELIKLAKNGTLKKV